MKTRITLSTLLAGSIAMLCLLPLPARADVATQSAGISTTITNNAVNNTDQTIVKVDRQNTVGLQLKMSGSEAGTGDVVIGLVRSADGTNFETTPTYWTNALAGATTVVAFREFSELGSAGYFRVTSVQNYDASAKGTNATLTVIKKRVSTQ